MMEASKDTVFLSARNNCSVVGDTTTLEVKLQIAKNNNNNNDKPSVSDTGIPWSYIHFKHGPSLSISLLPYTTLFTMSRIISEFVVDTYH
jgi:hypothetical protein